MPEIDGLMLTSWIKRHPRYHHIPIIIMTAEDSDQEKEKFLKEKVNYLFFYCFIFQIVNEN